MPSILRPSICEDMGGGRKWFEPELLEGREESSRPSVGAGWFVIEQLPACCSSDDYFVILTERTSWSQFPSSQSVLHTWMLALTMTLPFFQTAGTPSTCA
jgi:hypothetical protein